MVEQNAATMILDKELTGEKLSQNILDLYQNKDKRISMAENAKNMGKSRFIKQNYLFSGRILLSYIGGNYIAE